MTEESTKKPKRTKTPYQLEQERAARITKRLLNAIWFLWPIIEQIVPRLVTRDQGQKKNPPGLKDFRDESSFIAFCTSLMRLRFGWDVYDEKAFKERGKTPHATLSVELTVGVDGRRDRGYRLDIRYLPMKNRWFITHERSGFASYSNQWWVWAQRLLNQYGIGDSDFIEESYASAIYEGLRRELKADQLKAAVEALLTFFVKAGPHLTFLTGETIKE